MRTDQIAFDSVGTECMGTTYSPDAATTSPCVVLCTGFSGTQDTPALVAAATAFAEAGHVALTFDYRSFGLSGGEPRQVVDIHGQLDDIRAAIRYARNHPAVDPDRVVLWGTSLGGGHAVTVAADDPRLAAVIIQVPFNGFPKKAEGRSAKATRALLLAMLRDWSRGVVGRPPYYIPAVGGPGELAVMASTEAQRTINALDSATWQNRVAPRALLTMMHYKPGNQVHRLRMPLLVCIGEHDRETVAADTVKLAHRAPHGQLRTYPCAHFDIYRPDIRQKVIIDQIAFLNDVLAGDFT